LTRGKITGSNDPGEKVTENTVPQMKKMVTHQKSTGATNLPKKDQGLRGAQQPLIYGRKGEVFPCSIRMPVLGRENIYSGCEQKKKEDEMSRL